MGLLISGTIVLLIIAFGIIGFKRGIFSQIITIVGTILIFILAYQWKNPLADSLMDKLPFFSFGGLYKGAISLNILVYQGIAFLGILTVLSIILYIITRITRIFEKILKYTIILGIPSKILGFFAGLLEGYLLIFILVITINQIPFTNKYVTRSGLATKIVNETPILTKAVKSTTKTVKEIYSLKNKYKELSDDEFNLSAIDIMLRNKFITIESMDKLVNSKKIKIDGIDEVIDKYRVKKKTSKLDDIIVTKED